MRDMILRLWRAKEWEKRHPNTTAYLGTFALVVSLSATYSIAMLRSGSVLYGVIVLAVCLVSAVLAARWMKMASG